MGRNSGLLCHISSLPNKYCIGDFGTEAYNFVDFLKNADQTYWQVLPLTQPGATFSPYQSVSTYAINPMFVAVDKLLEEGLITEDMAESLKPENPHKIDFPIAVSRKYETVLLAAEKFARLGYDKREDFIKFEEENRWWLKDYALFMIFRKKFGKKTWNKWDKPYADREPEILAEAEKEYSHDIKIQVIIQYFLYTQWYALKKYANENGVKIIGDIPMYPDYDSVIVWANKELFMLDEENNPVFVAGVPPDYFCEDGQYWGNPFYNWEYIKNNKFEYWVKRLDFALTKADIVRIDHFRAFSQAWRIPANKERSAKNGEWMEVPGYDILELVRQSHPDMPIIAEDLGDIDDEVRELRDAFELPGMSILQFAFDSEDSLYLPHNQVRKRVLYTGTHDNNTTFGWWKSIDDEKKDYVRKYLSIDGNDISWQFIHAAAMTSADTVIFPIQDILRLDENYRMNIPGVVSKDNWAFRFSWDMVNDYYYRRLKEITGLYCRK